jgi:hypothetical protein
MALKKLKLRPGVNRENTRYTNEDGYYESNLVRFRQGTPEKIGGWIQISSNTFTGICRSLWNWVTTAGANLVGVGTEKKFYIEQTGAYYDVTPIQFSHALGSNPVTTVSGSKSVIVADSGYTPNLGDYVIFTGMAAFNNVTLNGQYLITETPTSPGSTLSTGTYKVTALTTADNNGSGGGSLAFASYLLSVGSAVNVGFLGWGSGTWGSSNWGGVGQVSQGTSIKLWTQYNFGDNLLMGPKQGPMYLWNATTAPTLNAPTTVTITNSSSTGVPALLTLTSNTTVPLPDQTAFMFETTGALPLSLEPYKVYYVKYLTPTTFNISLTAGGAAINTSSAGSGTHNLSIRAIPVSSLAGADSVPLTQNTLIVSDSSRYTIVFGSNDYASTTYDPMLIRWSARESVVEWAPSATNESGSLRPSHGSSIQAVLQARQEILVFTDAAVYSLQFLGASPWWGLQLLGDNTSIISLNAASYTNGTAYWMGQDKFYKYDGRVQTLKCDLRQFIYDDINMTQASQFFSSTNEGFNEVWWFYCTANSDTIDRYVVYNYAEEIWYYGSMERTAWMDSSLRRYPMAATYLNNLVYHEDGVDDNATGTPVAMESYITTSQFDIDDGNNFAFIWRMLPDLTFRGSTANTTPSLTMQLQTLKNSGSGYTTPESVGGTSANATQAVTATSTYPITAAQLDTYNGQVNIRVRGRQMSIRIACNTLGTQWQLGSPRIDVRSDGRR